MSVNQEPISAPEPMKGSKNVDLWINILSVVIPLVVALLLGIRTKIDFGAWTQYLPHAIGAINTATSVCLILGWIAQRAKRIGVHRLFMTSAFSLGSIFLVCYVTYHISNPSTVYGGEGMWKSIYYFVLISHILLSLIVLPLVLRAFLFGVTGQIARHKRISRWAFPIWLYVSLSGVIVYLMISPYYDHDRQATERSAESAHLDS